MGLETVPSRNNQRTINSLGEKGAFDCTILAMALRGCAGTIPAGFLILSQREREREREDVFRPFPITRLVSCIRPTLPKIHFWVGH